MPSYLAIAEKKDYQGRGGVGGTLVGSLIAPGATVREAEEAALALASRFTAIKESHGEKGDVMWGRVRAATMPLFRELFEAFVESELSFHCVYMLTEDLPIQGCCVRIYQLYRNSFAACLMPGDDCRVLVNERFDDRLCGGGKCSVVYIGRSPCKAGHGKPTDPELSFQHIADLRTVTDHVISPRTTCEIDFAHDAIQAELMPFCMMLLGAVAYTLSDERGNVAKLELCEMLAALDGEEELLAVTERSMGEGRIRITALKAQKDTISGDAPMQEFIARDPDRMPDGSKI